MRARVIAMVLVAAFAATASASNYARDDGVKIENIAVNAITYNGSAAYEYIYDMYVRNAAGKSNTEVYNMALQFEFGDGLGVNDHILNWYGTSFVDVWTQTGTTGQVLSGWWGVEYTGPHPAYGYRDTDTWVVTPPPGDLATEGWNYDPTYAASHGADNPYHVPSDYADVAIQGNILHWDHGFANDWAGDDGIADDIQFNYWAYWAASPDYLLYRTFRIISDLGPNGTVELGYDSGWAGNIGAQGGPVVGPGVPEPATLSLLAIGGLVALRRRRK